MWLLTALPIWFFNSLFNPLGAGVFTIVPSIGVFFLIVGIGIGALQRYWALSAFVVAPTMSEVFVGMAGYFQGKLQEETTLYIILTFWAFQILLISGLIYTSRGARLAAISLAIFCLTYAFFTGFVATMAFRNVWL